MKKIGILGGTFDPIHLGHVHLASEALKQCRLTEVRFIPCYQPAHREQPIASAVDRFSMLKLATEDLPSFIPDDRELKRQGVSYAVDTILSLKEAFPEATLFWILGSDAAQHFNQWHEWQALLQHCQLIIANRPGHEFTPPKALTKENYQLITIPPNPASATAIRQQLQQHSENLNPKVLKYINKKALYS